MGYSAEIVPMDSYSHIYPLIIRLLILRRIRRLLKKGTFMSQRYHCIKMSFYGIYGIYAFTMYSRSVPCSFVCSLRSFVRSLGWLLGCGLVVRALVVSLSLSLTHAHTTHRHKDYGSLNDKSLSLFAYPLYDRNIGFKAIVGLGLWLFGDTIPRKSQKKIYIM